MIAYASDQTQSGATTTRFIKPSESGGLRRTTGAFGCINERMLPLAVDGRFMACPYGTNFVGDIYTGVDWNKVDELTPKNAKFVLSVMCVKAHVGQM